MNPAGTILNSHKAHSCCFLVQSPTGKFALAVGRVSHRGSKINDEGLKELCEHLPNLESINLVLAAIADEARLVLNRRHRPDERRRVGDEIQFLIVRVTRTIRMGARGRVIEPPFQTTLRLTKLGARGLGPSHPQPRRNSSGIFPWDL